MKSTIPARNASALGLADRLRRATRSSHTQAERSGIMRKMLRRNIVRHEYCALLRSLHAIYAAIESAMATHARHPSIAPIFDRALWRRESIESDLISLHGRHWAQLPLAASAEDYVARVETVARSNVERLIAHAYVRYLGDLNGGQMLEPIVKESLRLDGDEGTRFYQFDVPDAQTRAATFRAALDGILLSDSASEAVLDEALWAFAKHIALFEELASSDF